MTDSTSAPAGVPQIPAGDQLGGKGTQSNQAPTNPIQEQFNNSVHGQVNPETPKEPPVTPEVPTNPVTPEQPLEQPKEVPKEQPKPADSYVQTSIVYLADELGFSEDDFDAVYANAVKHNDPALINPDALGKDLTDAQKQRVTQLAQLSIQEHNQGVERAKQEAYTVAGGEAQWNTAVQAFNANASADEKGYAGWLADNGRFKDCATYVTKVTQAGGFVNTEKQAPLDGGLGNVTSGLTKEAYQTEIGKIERSLGNRSMSSPEIKAQVDSLNARRALGRQQGL